MLKIVSLVSVLNLHVVSAFQLVFRKEQVCRGCVLPGSCPSTLTVFIRKELHTVARGSRLLVSVRKLSGEVLYDFLKMLS